MDPLFAILEIEREPLRLAELGSYIKDWLQNAGGFAAIALIIYLGLALIGVEGDRTWKKMMPFSLICAVLALLAFGGAAFFRMQEPAPPPTPPSPTGLPQKPPPPPVTPQSQRKEMCKTVGGALSLIGICLPFFLDLVNIRPRRIWALAKLSFKEAIRRRILWVFLTFLLLFLFPTKWFVQVKPEDEVRQTIAVVDFFKTIVMVLSFGLLASFSIPTDVKNQTIHTVVTKPVQRFEIILGRFFGYVGLATAVLIVLRLVALILIIASKPSAEAAFESFQARDAVYGTLSFYNRTGPVQGEFVGREWEYRKYIPGGDNSSYRALFRFPEVPNSMATNKPVPVEFSFDIFRTIKGEENKGVRVGLFFQIPGWTADRRRDYLDEVRRHGLNPGKNPQPEDTADLEKWNEVTEKFGYYELKGKEIADYHTFRIYVPGGLLQRAVAIQNAAKFCSARVHGNSTDPAARDAAIRQALDEYRRENPNSPVIDDKAVTAVVNGDASAFEARVMCESRSQFLGVAKRDLYLVADSKPFWVNFFKGAFGLWLLVCLMIGLAVTISTAFSGIVSWFLATLIIFLGYVREYIQEIAEGLWIGGGPAESLHRLIANSNLITPLDQSAPDTAVILKADYIVEWMYGRFVLMLPDIDRFDWTAYVAEGFNIPAADMFLAFLSMVGYMLPWLILGHYLMKSREVAN